MPEKENEAGRAAVGESGRLRIMVTSSIGMIPVQNARITISYKGVPDITVVQLDTDNSGQTETIDLPSPPIDYSMEPGRLEHLLIPELGVAFVTSRPGMAYPGKPYRRVRLDALSHPENKARLRFRARMAGVLREEGIAALQEAKAAHDLLEGVYNPYVDFEGVRAQAALEAGRLLSWMK